MKRRTALTRGIYGIMLGATLLPASIAAAGDGAKVRERADIELEYRWATERIFKSTDEWEAEFSAVEKAIEALATFKGTLNRGTEQLLKFLKNRDDVEARLERVYVYASLLADENTRDGLHQGMQSRARSLAIKYGQTTSWVQPELTAIPFARVDSWMRESAELEVYRQAFDNIYRQKKHILSPRE